jgi:flagellar hook-basal body complex protein FliE
VDSIGGNLGSGGNILFDQMKSNSALGKMGTAADAGKSAEGAGNVLQSFGHMLKEQMDHINNLQGEADQAAQTYAVGGDIELHNVILAADKADMALQLGMQVRNKVIAAYQEITHMNI